MDKNTARQLIKETFQNPFDKDRFIYFVKNLLNHIEEAPFAYKGNFIFDDFSDSINTVERIGKYKDPEEKLIDILIVRLKKETSLERARTKQRNFVAKYLKGSRGGVLKDAALVAFVSPNEDDWRFSLVKMEYKFNEKGKVEEEFTPARRHSFLVGIGESSHTAQSQLVPILEDDVSNPTLRRLEESFNIEKVTKEFFEKYRGLFLKFKESLDEVVKINEKVKVDFKTNNINTVDFAKKLLGQIVFLYFLQKKGWFGVKRDADWGTGPKNFLRELFNEKRGKYTNFFNDIMEPLFYQALRNDRRHDDDYYDKLKCKIPFLNGGLFDPINEYDWVHTDILLPNELFSNSEKTKEGDTGNGILDIFDRYNFTVKEDEPLEKEVAVDPEMLGKVFENLLEIKDRKSKGTYYTPREIVHYMCQQSLINYLATELSSVIPSEARNLEKDIEILIQYGESVAENEATVGMTKKYSYKLKESIRQNAKLIDEKLANIKICDPAIGSGAFPVGMMAEIVKARNVLSAYIKNKNRSTYSFKRECIEKSLYGVDIDPGAVEIAKLRLWLSLVVDEDDIKQIKPLPNLDYKIVCGNSLLSVEKNLFNNKQFIELERLKPLLFNETNPKKKQEYKEQIDKLISQITNGHKEFDFEIYFSEVFHENGGFDVVIANPPYVRQEEINYKQEMSREYEVFNSVSDLYTYFYEKGFKLLKKFGVLTFITSNKFLRARYGTILRKYLQTNTTIKSIVNFGDQHVFEAIANTLIFIATKQKTEKNNFNYSNNIVEVENKTFPQDELQDSEWTIDSPEIICLKNKIERAGTLLKDWDIRIDYGIKTGYNEAFIINEATKDELVKKDLEAREIIKPIIRGRDIERFYHRDSGLHLISIHNGYKLEDGSKVEAVDIKDYPAIKVHLDQYQDKLKERQDKGKTIYNLRDCAFIQDFAKEKIIWIELTDKNRFSYSEKEEYILAGAFMMTGKSLKFLLAFLNSKLCLFYFFLICNSSGMATTQWKKFALEKVPVKELSEKEQKPFVEIVDKILAITKSDDYLKNPEKKAKVKEYECQIDDMVYELYGLNKEEIKIVEGSSK